jgi:hypothetical protein
VLRSGIQAAHQAVRLSDAFVANDVEHGLTLIGKFHGQPGKMCKKQSSWRLPA